MTLPVITSINKPVIDYSFITAVDNNKEYFTRAEIEGVDEARDLQQLLVWPSDQQLTKILQDNLIINCHLTSDDVKRATAIYGPVISILKGKMIRAHAKHVKHKKISVHPTILSHHKNMPCF